MKLSLIAVSVFAWLSVLPACFAVVTFESDVVDPAESNLRRKKKNKVKVVHGLMTVDHIHHEQDADWNVDLLPTCELQAFASVFGKDKIKMVETEGFAESFMADDDLVAANAEGSNVLATKPHRSPMLGCRKWTSCWYRGYHRARIWRDPRKLEVAAADDVSGDDDSLDFLLGKKAQEKVQEKVCECLQNSGDPVMAMADNCHYYVLIGSEDLYEEGQTQVV